MRLKTLAPIVLLVLFTSTFDARAQQPGKSVAPSPAWNGNSLITVQKTRGDRAPRSSPMMQGFTAKKLLNNKHSASLSPATRSRGYVRPPFCLILHSIASANERI